MEVGFVWLKAPFPYGRLHIRRSLGDDTDLASGIRLPTSGNALQLLVSNFVFSAHDDQDVPPISSRP